VLFRPKMCSLFFCLSICMLIAASAVAQAAKPVRVTISGKIMAQKVKTKVAPVYPVQAKGRGIQGAVRLHIVITTTGTVTQVQVVAGDSALLRSAIEAVKQWDYEPTLIDGQPMEVDTVVVVNYSLSP